jgi:VWFA-related protein
VLTDNGDPRSFRLDNVDEGLAPIALVVLIETSADCDAALKKIKKVGAAIPLEVVGANGKAAVVTYDHRVTVAQKFTASADAITDAFSRLKASDSSTGRMIDAVEKALDMLQAQPAARRADILIIGESKDRGSETKLRDLLTRLQRSGVAVYAVGYSLVLTPFTTKASDYSPPKGGPNYIRGIQELLRLGKENTLETLASETGGLYLRFETKSKLMKDLIATGTDIHSRYQLSFPPDTAGVSSFHKIDVAVKGHPDAVVKARDGYWGGIPKGLP